MSDTTSGAPANGTDTIGGGTAPATPAPGTGTDSTGGGTQPQDDGVHRG
jgi:hypothetical protein